MIALMLAVLFTLGISALCSLLEAMILSVSTKEIEILKLKFPQSGEILEKYHEEIEETSSAILGLNTIANTAGASLSGALAMSALGKQNVVYFSLSLVLAILFFSEVIPKNIGILYRNSLLPWITYPLTWVRTIMLPVTWVCKGLIFVIAGKRNRVEVNDEEIALLAQKSAKDGNLTKDESIIITRALSLDAVRVTDVMTPRTVVMALELSQSIGDVFIRHDNIPFARLPIYKDNIDNIVGIVRRRDMLKAKAEDKDNVQLSEFMHDVMFIPEQANLGNSLQEFIKQHQQMAVVVDEFGAMAGVIAMEDVIEHILGKEIWETDDPAVDMRELARQKQRES